MVLDIDYLPNLKFHEPLCLHFPICKRKGAFEKEFFSKEVY